MGSPSSVVVVVLGTVRRSFFVTLFTIPLLCTILSSSLLFCMKYVHEPGCSVISVEPLAEGSFLICISARSAQVCANARACTPSCSVRVVWSEVVPEKRSDVAIIALSAPTAMTLRSVIYP